MAYNNFSTIYPQQFYYPQQYSQNQHSSGIIWVQGEAGAKSYLVAPNSTVQLWDSESQTIYLKSADASGMPSMKVLDYKIREQEAFAQPSALTGNNVDYALKNDVNELKDELNKVKDELSRIMEGRNYESKRVHAKAELSKADVPR